MTDELKQWEYDKGYTKGYSDGRASLNKELEDIKAEIKKWYWRSDKQELAKDPCVIDAMTDLFIRTINKHIKKEDSNEINNM